MFTIWDPVVTFRWRKLSKPWWLSYKNDKITAKTVSQLKCLEGRKTVGIYLANEISGIAFLSTDLGQTFRSRVGDEFGVVLKKKDLTNQNLLTTLSAYTLSCYTQIWLKTIVSMTRRPCYCVAFLFFQSSKLPTLKLLDSTSTIGPFVTYKSDRCPKNPFIPFTLTRETRAKKKYSVYLSVSSVLFWCLGKPPTFLSNLKDVTRWLRKTSRESILKKLSVNKLDGDSAQLYKLLGETILHFRLNTSS